MFGGIAFLVNGNMACGVVRSELMVRVGADAYERTLEDRHVAPMTFTGKALRGFVYVEPSGLSRPEDVARWARRGLEHARSLPRKKAKSVAAQEKKVVKKDDALPPFAGFPKVTFDFLRGIAEHNEKAWFDDHRAEYDAGYVEPARAFVAALGPELRKISKGVSFEPKVNGSLFRIQRDVRFSKDKTPYKTHLDLWFWEGERRGWDSPGFFFRMFERTIMIGAGMHGLQKESLDRYRQAVLDPKAGKALERLVVEIESRGDLKVGGATRAKVPRGFDPEHPRAKLLLHEGLFAHHEGKVPKEAKSAVFVAWCAERYARCAPIVKWLHAHVTE